MQTFEQRGRYFAEWGGFSIALDNAGSRWLAEIRQRDGGAVVAVMPELPPRTTREAIEWAAEQLEQRGAVAFVDGKRSTVAPFLNFVGQPEQTR